MIFFTCNLYIVRIIDTKIGPSNLKKKRKKTYLHSAVEGCVKMIHLYVTSLSKCCNKAARGTQKRRYINDDDVTLFTVFLTFKIITPILWALKISTLVLKLLNIIWGLMCSLNPDDLLFYIRPTSHLKHIVISAFTAYVIVWHDTSQDTHHCV